ncbi:unnamed protein product [Coregonus sp. 'balchen']|nr:unnamed protein product [Coregonus sp. 'balchen']
MYLETRGVQLIIGGSLVAVVLVLAVVVGVYCIHKRRTPPQSPGMETPCDATLDGAQCYGALGGTVSLQLMIIDSKTLDEHPLRDTEASPGDQTNTMTLKRGLSGDLTCTVKNHISSVTVSKIISPCEGLMHVNYTSNGTKISEWVIAVVVCAATEQSELLELPPATQSRVDTQQGHVKHRQRWREDRGADGRMGRGRE